MLVELSCRRTSRRGSDKKIKDVTRDTLKLIQGYQTFFQHISIASYFLFSVRKEK